MRDLKEARGKMKYRFGIQGLKKKGQADEKEPVKTTERNSHRGIRDPAESRRGSCWGCKWGKSLKEEVVATIIQCSKDNKLKLRSIL